MAERLRCRLCDHALTVSEEDPDSTVDDMVHHVARLHAGDPLAGDPAVIVLEPGRPALPGGSLFGALLARPKPGGSQ